MILWVRGDPFPAGAINDLTLADLQEFDRWLLKHPRSISHWWELPGLADEYNTLPDRHKATHPEAALLLAVRTWATLRKARLSVSFDEVLGIGPDELGVTGTDETETAESLPRGFRAGNVQHESPDLGEYDLEHEVYGRLLLVMHHFPGITPVSVWDVPLFVWMGMASQVDAWRRKG